MVKPGYRTTEFAGVVASLVVTLLVMAGIAAPGDEEELTGVLGEAIVAGSTFVGNALVLVAYIRSRTEVKRVVALAEGPALEGEA
jgi:hypothetical protein